MEWKTIKGYEGLYRVSSTGLIEGQKGNILKQGVNQGGYPYVNLCNKESVRKNTRIHRIVAETFIENPNNYKYVNHIDGNKLNNNKDNLEFCSQAYNIKEAYRLGLNTSKSQYKKVQMVNVVTDEVLEVFESMSHASRFLGAEGQNQVKGFVSNIKRAITGKRPSAYGYKWREC